MAALDSLLRTLLEKGGPDLHLTLGLPPPLVLAPSRAHLNFTP